MATAQMNNGDRREALRAILNHERNQALARVREYRRDQEDEVTPPPGDEMDVARSLADIETHASLIERVEDRLKALPFAGYCVDCQQKRNHLTRSGKPWVDEPFIHQWDLPEEMGESTETSHNEFVPLPSGEEELSAPSAEPSRPRAVKKKPKARPRHTPGRR
jgi:RNA polymerase-binding transcription factor DksA